MENLINFDENESKDENIVEPTNNLSKNIFRHPLLINDRLSFELNNPFDNLEYRITHSDDPFECLEKNKLETSRIKDEVKKQNQLSENELLGSLLGSMNSKIDVLNSTDPSPATSTTSSFIADNDSESSGSTKTKTLKRCQSDSSTASTNEDTSRYSSVDNIFSSKTNQLLKLSLLNSPNSPLHSSSRTALDGSLIETVCQEAKKISEKLSSFNEMSFEDLNNISQQLVDTSAISAVDTDLEQMKISFLENNPEISTQTPSSTNNNEKSSNIFENIQEKLNQIKKEKVEFDVKPEPVEVKEEKIDTPQKTDREVDDILQNLKTLMKNNNKAEAKKQLKKLSDLLGGGDSAKTLQVQPMVRQDTFEIDQKTGKRKYLNNNSKHEESEANSNTELIEQLAKLFGAQSLDVGSLNVSNDTNQTKYVVIMPNVTPAVTPVKQNINSRRSVSFSTQRPSTAIKGIENKKLSTPMKPSTSVTSSAVRRSSFTAPRTFTKAPHPYEQKLNMGTVRKSLMDKMDKSPSKSNANAANKNLPPRPPSNVRRSISLKANIPTIKFSEPSPTKNRPTTMTAPKTTGTNPSRPSMPANRRLSSLTRPSTANQQGLLTTNRPVTRKSEFKAPLSTPRISSSKESMV
ncbi:putative leucine-rich repeat-containing protein DDB_G0290503 [Chironomus tepperi]|uniref:putative leucine-rich repeat-containing protein DDB_G0290503 n=1 Tax=Chironomus tepperi TaxID=113505 RepID=UPI00391F89C6